MGGKTTGDKKVVCLADDTKFKDGNEFIKIFTTTPNLLISKNSFSINLLLLLFGYQSYFKLHE